MARRSKKGAEASGEAAPRSRGNLVPAVVLALGLAAGGFFMGGGGGAPAPAAEATTTTTTVHEPGPVVVLAPITLNMADGRYLKVGMALELDGEHADGGDGHGKPKDDGDPTKGFARALDVAIEVLGGRTFDELVTADGREDAKAVLNARLHEVYGEKVHDVYFTEFVMQ
jgi:flagellar protein FliL